MLVVNIQQMTNLFFAGHLGDGSMIAAIGLGILIQNVFIETIMWSFNASLENLVSQAVGAGSLRNCGIYLNQGTFVLLIAFLFIYLLMVKVEEFLIYLDQDPVVSEKTEQYVLWYMPALFIYMINDLNRKFLNSFRMTMVPFLSFTISVAFHPVWVKIFVIDYGLGLQGIALAGTITNLITFTVIKVFIRN